METRGRPPRMPNVIQVVAAVPIRPSIYVGTLPPMTTPTQMPSSSSSPSASAPASAPAAAPSPVPFIPDDTTPAADGNKRKRDESEPAGGNSRKIYSSGDNLERLSEAVNAWDSKTGMFLEEPGMTKKRLSEIAGIPYATFKQYTCDDKGKRKDGERTWEPAAHVKDTAALGIWRRCDKSD